MLGGRKHHICVGVFDFDFSVLFICALCLRTFDVFSYREALFFIVVRLLSIIRLLFRPFVVVVVLLDAAEIGIHRAAILLASTDIGAMRLPAP